MPKHGSSLSLFIHHKLGIIHCSLPLIKCLIGLIDYTGNQMHILDFSLAFILLLEY
jgi:hypothetical protein